MAEILAPCCAALEYAGLTSEAATIRRLIKEGHYRASYNRTFTEDRDVVTLVHGDLWSSNMMFKVTNRQGHRGAEDAECRSDQILQNLVS